MTTITMKEVAAFLLGEAPLDGFWFGERHPAGGFWWREHLRAAQPATAPEPSTEVAVGKLCKSLHEDLDYAWTWHCNIAMAAFDAGCPHDVANEGAARFMQLLAGVDTREHPAFQGTQDHPMRNDKTAPAQPALERKPMTDEEVIDLVRECGLDWHKGFMPLFDDDPTNRFAVLVRAVEAFHDIKENKS